MKRIPLKKRGRSQPARDRARVWLVCMLSDGPLTVEYVRSASHKAGIAWRTLRRARIGIAEPVRVGFAGGYWIWQMSTPNAEGVHISGVCPVCGRGGGVGQ